MLTGEKRISGAYVDAKGRGTECLQEKRKVVEPAWIQGLRGGLKASGGRFKARGKTKSSGACVDSRPQGVDSRPEGKGKVVEPA
eukprot:1194521-Prorocentrum_minimum.AAC.2